MDSGDGGNSVDRSGGYNHSYVDPLGNIAPVGDGSGTTRDVATINGGTGGKTSTANQGGNSGSVGTVNNGLAALGIGLSANNELWDFAVRTSFKSANTISEWNALRATQQAFRVTNALGNTGAKVLKFTKGLGTVANYAGAVIVLGKVAYNGRIAPSDVLDGVVAGASFIPVYGWAIGGLYFLGDVATKQITGQSIGDHLNNYYGDPALGHLTW